MIKIEKISEGCDANIAGEPIFVGALINMKQLGRLVVTKGEVMYTINEKEIVYRTVNGDSDTSSLGKEVLEKEVVETLIVPNIEPIEDSAKPIQNLDSAKPIQNLDSAKPIQNLDSAKPTKK